VPIVDEEEPVEIGAPARAPWQTPHAVVTELDETQGVSRIGGDIYSSHS
jgi:hypothetical protein